MKNINYQGYLNSIVDFDGYVEQITQEVMEKDCSSTIVSADNNLIGEYESLPWDSEILGVSTVRINNILFTREPQSEDTEAFVDALDTALMQKKVTFAFVRLNTERRPFVAAFERSGWFVADTLNIYTADTTSLSEIETVPVGLDVIVKEPLLDDVILFFEREKDLFLNARMYKDSHIARDTARIFYRDLFSFVFNKKTSVKLGLYKDNQLIGVVVGERDALLEKKTQFKLAYLWEIGICSEARGKGYSKLLLKAFFERMFHDDTVVEIGTQIDNLAANGLYRSCGATLVSQASTLHKWFA